MIPIAYNSWFANKSTTQHTFSSKFRKHYIKQKVNRAIYPAKFTSIHAANYSEAVEFYRLNQSTTEAENLTVGRHRAHLATVQFSEFIMHRINSDKINKIDSNLTRFIFSFCSIHELVLNFTDSNI